MRRLAATAVLSTTLLAPGGVAHASWSQPTPVSLAHASPYAQQTDAVDARGDAAVAWETVGAWPRAAGPRRCSPSPTRQACLPVSTVHLAVRSVDGHVEEHALWSSRINPTIRLSLVIGAGRVTLSWGYSTAASTSVIARLASGPLTGRWGPPRVIARYSTPLPMTASYPQLAIAPSGEVLALWEACTSTSSCSAGRGHVFVMRRPSGGTFGAARAVAGAPRGAIAQFDARGTAYLSGGCSGRVLISPAGARRFTRTVVVSSGPVSMLTLSLAGDGHGLAAWIAGACSYDEAVPNTPGPVLLSTVRDGAFSAPRMLTAPATPAFFSNAVAIDDGGEVSWVTYEGATALTVFSARIGANGPPESTQQGTGAIIAVCADAAGDLVFTRPPGAGATANEALVRPAHGADQPAPAATGAVAASPFGRSIALAWYATTTRLELSVWRP